MKPFGTYKPDIKLGYETWPKPTITNQEIIPPGYEVYRKDRHDGYGGVLVIVKSCYISSIVDINIHSELVAIHIEGVHDNSSLVVASFYRQPNRDIDHTHRLCQDLKGHEQIQNIHDMDSSRCQLTRYRLAYRYNLQQQVS